MVKKIIYIWKLEIRTLWQWSEYVKGFLEYNQSLMREMKWGMGGMLEGDLPIPKNKYALPHTG